MVQLVRFKVYRPMQLFQIMEIRNLGLEFLGIGGIFLLASEYDRFANFHEIGIEFRFFL